ncbi:MAG: chorismate synthase [Ruminococcus sp.]|jgi:chorismate synthase|nr:chorismate synthase [Ruminococcus sp.]
MSSIYTNNISLSIFGESHGPAIGCVLDNLPSGEFIDIDAVRSFMTRRAPKSDGTTTSRSEKDFVKIMSGLNGSHTTGTPLMALIENTDMHSGDYSNLNTLVRPGHADYTGAVRYKGFEDKRGGGHFSGRLTAPLCFAGAIAGQILERRSIYTGAYVKSIHSAKSSVVRVKTREDIINVRNKALTTLQHDLILQARGQGESLGGVIECHTINMPVGIGSPIFDGLESTIARLVFAVPAVKGIEFGLGFKVSEITGSQNNDEFYIDDFGHTVTRTNNHGGILGGISSGMPIVLRVAIKPTPSIAKPQKTVDIKNHTEEMLEIKGRHDPCIVPRAVPCIESSVNIALLSHLEEARL